MHKALSFLSILSTALSPIGMGIPTCTVYWYFWPLQILKQGLLLADSRAAEAIYDVHTTGSRQSISTKYRPISRRLLTLSGHMRYPLCKQIVMVAPLPFFTTCSDDSKPYMILKGLDESYKNHVGFAIIRARGR